MQKLKGSCLCGSIRYSCEADPLYTATCHCLECQKSTGSAFSVVVGVKKTDFAFSGNTLKTFEGVGDSGKPIYRHFCSSCGSPVFSESESRPGIVNIKAGTLENSCELKPSVNVYWRDHQRWINDMEEIPRHETMLKR